MDFGEWRPYVPVAARRMRAAREIEKRRKQGYTPAPVEIRGRVITTTFWGRAWCQNLERYSDYANRLPRGRTYVRNGSVVDLQVGEGVIHAFVSGSDLYEVRLEVARVSRKHWELICSDCAGGIDSLVELLQGRLASGVMERICRPKEGLFPAPSEIRLSCSCPDWADMCKHVAAVLYGVGARLDKQPELLFRLRGVDETELIAEAGMAPLQTMAAGANLLADADLGAMFGIEMAETSPPVRKPAKKPAKEAAAKKTVRKAVKKKAAGKRAKAARKA